MAFVSIRCSRALAIQGVREPIQVKGIRVARLTVRRPCAILRARARLKAWWEPRLATGAPSPCGVPRSVPNLVAPGSVCVDPADPGFRHTAPLRNRGKLRSVARQGRARSPVAGPKNRQGSRTHAAP